jgi:glucan phosphoethanolaminetransferase (alkaline phosphatase superfamily)
MKHSENVFQKIKKFFNKPDTWVWLFAILLLVPNIALCVTEPVSVLSKLTNLLLPLGIYLLLISLSKKIGRTIFIMMIVCVFCAFQIVLLFLYGQSIISIDMFMNVVTTNASEAGELLSNLKAALAAVFVCYLPPLFYAGVAVNHKYHAKKTTLLRARRVGASLAALGLVTMFGAKAFTADYRMSHELFPYNVVRNLITAVERSVESANYHDTSANFSYAVTTSHPADQKEVYVFVIGETSRADNWQLFGYNRPTNPRLSQRSNLTAFAHTMSEINTTHKSVPMLMSYLNSENFGDSVAHSRSIFAAFNDCNYATAFFSNQRRNHSYIDYYGEEAKTTVFLTDDGEVKPDLNLVDALRNYLTSASAKKIFVVLHTYGSHFEYRNRYSADMAYFKPEACSDATVENRAQLVNAYDNTIRYTDAVLDGVISVLSWLRVPAAMLYTSDHGEDIYDDARRRFLHSSPVPTYWQLHVPLLVWLSPEYVAAYPAAQVALMRNADKDVSSTTSAFHTILDIAGMQSPYFNPTRSLISDSYTPAPHRLVKESNV